MLKLDDSFVPEIVAKVRNTAALTFDPFLNKIFVSLQAKRAWLKSGFCTSSTLQPANLTRILRIEILCLQPIPCTTFGCMNYVTSIL